MSLGIIGCGISMLLVNNVMTAQNLTVENFELINQVISLNNSLEVLKTNYNALGELYYNSEGHIVNLEKFIEISFEQKNEAIRDLVFQNNKLEILKNYYEKQYKNEILIKKLLLKQLESSSNLIAQYRAETVWLLKENELIMKWEWYYNKD